MGAVIQALPIPGRRTLRVIAIHSFLFAVAFSVPLLVLDRVQAAATPCGANCGNHYAGQVLAAGNGAKGVRGYVAFPSTTLTSPSNDGILHWIGLTYTGGWGGFDWLQFGAWNGFGNGGTGTSTYNWYGEFNSWCNGYSVSTYGTTASSAGRLQVLYYTGESYDCGSGGAVTVYRVLGWSNDSTNSKSVWVRGAYSRADANDELKMYSYFEPLGGNVCFGTTLSGGSCTSSSSANLQLQVVSWSDWIASVTVVDTRPSSYWRTVINSNYRFRINGAY